MTPKPLTSEERLGLSQELLLAERGMSISGAAHVRLAASEQFWREAVRDCYPIEYYGMYGDRQRCRFCGRNVYDEYRGFDAHEPDCAWLLAQEEELK